MAIKSIIKNFKINRWWVDKIAAGVFTYLFFASVAEVDNYLGGQFYLLFFILIMLAISGHLINDFSDIEIDRKSEKQNIVEQFGKRISILLLTFLVLGVLLLSVIKFDFLFTGLVVFQILLNISYSIRPFRLKERGVWALVITGFYERVLPYILIIYILGFDFENFTNLTLGISFLAWAYLWEIRNHINGQMLDFKTDAIAQVETWVRNIGLVKANIVSKKLILIEAIIFLTWLGFYTKVSEGSLFAIFVLAFVALDLWIGFFENFKWGIANQFSTLYRFGLLSSIVLSSFLLEKISLGIFISLTVLFSSSYLISLCKFIYYRLRHIFASVVNYSIYYYRQLAKNCKNH